MALDKRLLSGSLILIFTIGISNVLNYVFHFSMARILSITDYGMLATLFSFFYLLMVFSESIQTVTAKYASGVHDAGKLKNLFKRTLKKAFLVSSLVSLIFFIVSLWLTSLLHIPYYLFFLTGAILFMTFFLPIGRGIMQGRKQFIAMGTNVIIEAGSKLILSLLLVIIGWNVLGAMLGVFLAAILSFLFSLIIIKDVIYAKEVSLQTSNIYKYTPQVVIVNLIVLAFYSLDILIARAVFTPELSGQYAIASTIGKILFLMTQPISKALFPLSAEKHIDSHPRKLFFNALFILSFLLLVALLFIYLLPDFLVHIFSGKVLPLASSVLILISLAMSLLSITNLVLIYKVSRSEIKGSYLLILFLILQIALLVIYSKDLFQFSLSLVVSSLFLLGGSIFLCRRKSSQ